MKPFTHYDNMNITHPQAANEETSEHMHTQDELPKNAKLSAEQEWAAIKRNYKRYSKTELIAQLVKTQAQCDTLYRMYVQALQQLSPGQIMTLRQELDDATKSE